MGEETTSFPEFCPTRGGHGVGGVRGGWYMNLGAQSLTSLGVLKSPKSFQAEHFQQKPSKPLFPVYDELWVVRSMRIKNTVLHSLSDKRQIWPSLSFVVISQVLFLSY